MPQHFSVVSGKQFTMFQMIQICSVFKWPSVKVTIIDLRPYLSTMFVAMVNFDSVTNSAFSVLNLETYWA